MASLIPGYNYDIFISYRQKDNKYDGWVTEFVDHLKRELEATFKEDLSIYFDENPLDGLLETHSVDKSLGNKLKCLIFIPIISQTYCDPKSFAWHHELCFFNKLAKEDKFGMDIRLTSGNVASRILPVRIHDLDPEDKLLLENELGGMLRSIEFIYKSAGVNRPLRSKEENPKENLNHTLYRDQINKVANAIKEIIKGLKNEPIEFDGGELKGVTSINIKPPIQEKSIIVLPFDNMSPDPDQEYFSDGLTEEIITDLSHIHDLLVISRSSAMTFKGTNKTILEIAQAVNVNYVLEGSVRKSGNNLRITAQLIDANTDVHLWAEKFSGTLEDVFDIQEKVSHFITEALKIRLVPDRKKQFISQGTKSVKAYEFCLRSRHYRNLFTKKGFYQAIEFLEQALIEDKNYALAYAETAMCYWGLGTLGHISPGEAYQRLKLAATDALNIDESLAEGHIALGFYYWDYDWNWTAAEKEFVHAIHLKPGDSWVHMVYSWFLGTQRRHIESITEMKRALELDPLSISTAACIGEELMFARESDLAIEQCKNVISKDATYWATYSFLGFSYFQKGYSQEAVDAFEKSVMLADRDIVPLAFWGYGLGIIGKTKEAREILDELLRIRNITYLSPFWIATVHMGLGEYEVALDWLQKGYEERAAYMYLIHLYEQFVPLHNDPRFKELCRKINLII